MKNLIYSSLIGLTLFGSIAHADYNCLDYDKHIQLSVNENHFTRIGDTSVIVTSAEGQSQFYGIMKIEDGNFLKKKSVTFFPFNGDSLKIVTQPQYCGRVACDPDSKQSVTAELSIGETKTFFKCDEISK